MTAQPASPSPKSEALDMLKALTQAHAAQAEEIKYLIDLVQPITEALQHIQDVLSRPIQQPAATPADADGCTTFTATEITLTYNDKGQPVTRFKGGRYMKFGVMCWPETLAALGFDVAALKPGPNPIPPLLVYAALNENGQPRKIIGRSPQPAAPRSESAAFAGNLDNYAQDSSEECPF